MKLEEFIQCMELLSAAIPKHSPKDTRLTASLWFKNFSNISVEAFMALIFAAQNRYDSFPSIKELQELISGNKMAEADALPELIWSCITDYGSQMAKIPRIQERLGPTGWQFVERVGGWQAICNQAEDNDMAPTLKAQWRNAIKAMVSGGPVIDRMNLPGKVHDELKSLADGFSLTPALPTRQNK